MAEVIGISKFREHFKVYTDNYVLIGGSACSLLMDEAGLDYRATKDLDLVLCVEALSEVFVKHFWEFIKLGEYASVHKSTGKKCFYRFTEPKDKSFPFMIEILSDQVDIYDEIAPGAIIPIRLEEEIVSLSAILLNKVYYEFIMGLKRVIEDITIADHHVIIPLKARAFLDLTERKANRETIRGDDIKKHKNDIYRLTQLLTGEPLGNVPTIVSDDIRSFVEQIADSDELLKQIGIEVLTMSDIKETLLAVYCS